MRIVPKIINYDILQGGSWENKMEMTRRIIFDEGLCPTIQADSSSNPIKIITTKGSE